MKLPFDISVYFTIFFTFTVELLFAAFLLTPDKKAFRFKPYLGIPLSLAIAFSGSFLVFFLSTLVPWNAVVNISAYFVLFWFIYLSIFLLYRQSWTEVLLRVVVAYTMQHMCYQFSNLFYDTGVGKYIVLEDPVWSNVLSNVVFYGIKVVCYAAFIFTLVPAYIKYCKYMFRTAGVIIIAFVEFLLVNAANVCINQYLPPFFPIASGVISFTLIWCCVLMDWVVLYCFKNVKQQAETAFLKADYQARIDAIAETQESVAFINVMCHDLRKQIRFIKNNKNLLTDEDLNQMEEALRIYDTGMKTGNKNLDLFLQARALYCRSKNIELTTLIDGSLFENFDQNDVFYLLMNVLDNAVEAAEKVEDPAKRTISLTTRKKAGCFLIEERNYFVGEIKVNPDGSPKTTKTDSSMHGFGFKSIQRIVTKYGGSLSFTKDNGIFELNIVF